MKINKGIWSYYILSILLIIFDQISKVFIKGFNLLGLKWEGMNLGDSINVFGETVQLTFIENAGMAFGISFGPAKIILSLFSVIASCFLVYYLNKIYHYSRYLKLGVAIILAGAVGNLIDRVFYGVFYGEAPLFYGKVVDFVRVDIPDINIFGLNYTHWPIFNVADSCITIGVVILLIFNKHIPSFSEVFKKEENINNE
jgi:signal peptidase II